MKLKKLKSLRSQLKKVKNRHGSSLRNVTSSSGGGAGEVAGPGNPHRIPRTPPSAFGLWPPLIQKPKDDEIAFVPTLKNDEITGADADTSKKLTESQVEEKIQNMIKRSNAIKLSKEEQDADRLLEEFFRSSSEDEADKASSSKKPIKPFKRFRRRSNDE